MAATRRCVTGARSWSIEATRLARISDLWLTTEDCAQAAGARQGGKAVGAILTPESLKAIRIPVGIVEGQGESALTVVLTTSTPDAPLSVKATYDLRGTEPRGDRLVNEDSAAWLTVVGK